MSILPEIIYTNEKSIPNSLLMETNPVRIRDINGHFSSIIVEQNDPTLPLTGAITFTLGSNSMTLDLAAGDRYLTLAGDTAFLDLNCSGLVATDKFRIVLV